MAGGSGAIRAGKAFVEFFVDNKRLVAGLKNAQRRMSAWAAGVGAMGAKIAMAGVAMALPILAAVKTFASLGDQLDKMSARTGVSVEMLSKLGFAAERSGSSLEAVEKGTAAMGRFMVDLETGSKTAVDMLDMMGLSMDDLANKSPDERLETMVNALGNIEDPSIRAGVAMKVLGRAGRELIPMAENFAELSAEAERLGVVMSTEDAAAAAALTDAWGDMVTQLKAVAIQIGSAVAPALKELFGRISPMIKSSIEWAKANKGLMMSIAKGVTMLLGLGVGLLIVSKVLALAAFGFGVLATAISFLPSLMGIGIVAAGVAGLAAVTGTTTDDIKSMFGGVGKFVGGIWDSIKGTATKAYGAIVEKIGEGDLEGAFKVAWAAIKVMFFDVTAELTEEWATWSGAITDVWNNAIGDMVITLQNWGADVKRVIAIVKNEIGQAASAFKAEWQAAWEYIKGLAGQSDRLDPSKIKNVDEGEIIREKAGPRQDDIPTVPAMMNQKSGLTKELEEIEQERTRKVTFAENVKQERLDKNAAATAKTIADAKARAAAAATALEDAMKPGAVVAGKAAADAGQQPDMVSNSFGGMGDFKSGLGRGDQRRFVLEQRMSAARAAAGTVIRENAGSVGTFSGRAAGQMGAIGPMARVAKATEAIAENTSRGANASEKTADKIDGLMMEAE